MYILHATFEWSSCSSSVALLQAILYTNTSFGAVNLSSDPSAGEAGRRSPELQGRVRPFPTQYLDIPKNYVDSNNIREFFYRSRTGKSYGIGFLVV